MGAGLAQPTSSKQKTTTCFMTFSPRGIQFDLGRAEAEFDLVQRHARELHERPCALIVRSSQVLSIAAWGCGTSDCETEDGACLVRRRADDAVESLRSISDEMFDRALETYGGKP